MMMSNEAKRTLRIHSILYLNEPERIGQTIRHLDRAIDHAIAKGAYDNAVLVYGDCSPKPVFSAESIEALRSEIYALERFDYRYFDANLGSAHGHNRLLEDLKREEDVLIINPDIMLAPNTIVELWSMFSDPKVGMAEAKQLPIEHPKQYDSITGETSWAATACTLIRGETALDLSGFDHETFFLYCDDVDFSWRVRLAGQKVVYVPSALAFHDKRLGRGGNWEAGSAERFYSAQAALFLAYKYCREDLTERWLTEFEATGDDNFIRAAASYRKRKADGSLPDQLDSKHQIGCFIDGNYAPHRFQM
jgi:GT2 family glycosyltransferase